MERWHTHGERVDDRAFEDLALRIFDYQLRYNAPYAAYCARLGVHSAPQSWERIPAVPAPAFKEASLATFDPARAALVFETSGTTRGTAGRHFMETPALYDASLLAGFDRFVLRDRARLRFLSLVPNPTEHPHSSLGYMIARLADQRGEGCSGWYLRNDELLVESFATDVRDSIEQGAPVCIATTSFALARILDALDERSLRFELPPGSRVVETGGFKGRTRVVAPQELQERTCERFGVTPEAIIAEYGMTELTSQYYSRPAAARRYTGPPWLRARVVGPQRATLAKGNVGSLVHVDLANRSTCIAIQTEDLGIMSDDGLVLIGRERDAPARGCSLDAEGLRAQAIG